MDNYQAFLTYVSNYKNEVDYLLHAAAKKAVDLMQESTSQGRGTRNYCQ